MSEKRKASEAIFEMLDFLDYKIETEMEKGIVIGLKIAQQIALEMEVAND